MEFDVNNGRKINLEQAELNGPVSVTTWEAPQGDGITDCEREYTISPVLISETALISCSFHKFHLIKRAK